MLSGRNVQNVKNKSIQTFCGFMYGTGNHLSMLLLSNKKFCVASFILYGL